jgi:NADH-quinone oxidoreductase subunit J
MHLVLFLIFAALALGGGIGVLAQHRPIGSALSLIVVMGALAGLYMLLGAEFVAVIQVIIYAGAVMVLFVFVIMLVDAEGSEMPRTSRVALAVGLPSIVLGVLTGAWVVLKSFPVPAMLSIGELHGTATNLGRLLFGEYLLPFEFTSALILIAIMGAVVLARKGE